MDDDAILTRIRTLVDEEDRLHGPDDPLTPDETRRRDQIEGELDQCYDLLRLRRARIRQGGNPDDVAPRPIEQVESYVGEDGGPPR